jgi:hypothetical protein
LEAMHFVYDSLESTHDITSFLPRDTMMTAISRCVEISRSHV